MSATVTTTVKVTIQDVRNVNNKRKEQSKTIGGIISNILTLDKNGLEPKEKSIIDFLVKAKKDSNIYKQLCDVVKPHYKTGSYNAYAILTGVKALLNK